MGAGRKAGHQGLNCRASQGKEAEGLERKRLWIVSGLLDTAMEIKDKEWPLHQSTEWGSGGPASAGLTDEPVERGWSDGE